MSRRYPHRRRKRRGRRPPNRYQGGSFPVRPNSFQDFGLKSLYDWLLPELGIHNRRGFFNQAGGWMTLGGGIAGALVGLTLAGPGGAIVLGGLTLAITDHSLRKHRLIR